MNNKLINFLIVLGLILVLLVGIFVIVYYFKINSEECMAEPFVYGAKQFENRIGKKIIGTISVLITQR